MLRQDVNFTSPMFFECYNQEGHRFQINKNKIIYAFVQKTEDGKFALGLMLDTHPASATIITDIIYDDYDKMDAFIRRKFEN